MATKLTLTIDKKVIDSAKKYAERKGKSLSHIVENYLMLVTSKEIKEDTLSPKVTRFMGVIKLPTNFDYKKEMGNALTKKYKK